MKGLHRGPAQGVRGKVTLLSRVSAFILSSGVLFLTPHISLAEDETSAATPSVVATPEPEKIPQELIDRSFAGQETDYFPETIYESVQPIESSASGFIAVPDRWRMFYAGKWYDPYNQNVLKGDIPVFGSQAEPWFTEVSVISDTFFEARRIPVPVGFASTRRPNSNNVFGDGNQTLFGQNVIMSFGLIKGNTAFKPPDFELRIAPIFNFSYVKAEEDGILFADPARGDTRSYNDFGFQELFADIHLANLSERYDFVSMRGGIQQFNADFRGFLYNDNQPGVRFFGDYDNNKTQFNFAWFNRLDKNVNSGINSTFDNRYETVAVANTYRQDLLAQGHTTSLSVVYRGDTAGDHGYVYDQNGFLVRPAAIGDERPGNIYSTYFGLGGDGHIDRINTTTQLYYALGSQSHSEIAQQQVDISAGMAAQEFSYDMDWIRFRVSGMWASGDKDPYNGKATGFDAIYDSPNFAGGDLSYWQREGFPFVGGGGTNFVNRNSLLPNFRATKEMGQSNFVNPGLRLYNLGVDFELLPELKLVTNASYLQFDQTESIEALRMDGSVSRNIGWDLSAGVLYRPFLNQNVLVRVGSAVLLPEAGQENLFGNQTNYHAFTNLILQY